MRSLAAISCIAVLLAGASACATADASSPLVPGFLIGTWRTDTESHSGTFLRLTATTISFGTAEDTIERYAVERVTRTEDWFGPLYTIEYRDSAGDHFEIGLYFDDRKVLLRNQRQMEWTWSRY